MSVLVFLQYFEICHTTVDNIFLGAILLFVCEMNVNNRKILIPTVCGKGKKSIFLLRLFTACLSKQSFFPRSSNVSLSWRW